jgi:hypothetical protein
MVGDHTGPVDCTIRRIAACCVFLLINSRALLFWVLFMLYSIKFNQTPPSRRGLGIDDFLMLCTRVRDELGPTTSHV